MVRSMTRSPRGWTNLRDVIIKRQLCSNEFADHT